MNPTRTIRAWLTGVLTLLLLALCPRLYAYDLTVDRSQPVSATNFQTVQAAINAAPTGRTSVYTIFIKNGKYKESILVPSNKPFIQLVGESVANTILTYNNSGGTVATAANNPNSLVANGSTFGTQNSASFTVNAPDFSAVNITFENAFGEAASNGQAVAILVNADRAAFRNCRFLGNQDTMYLKGSNVGNQAPRYYFVDCYIEGNTDFIFGSSIALFERCNVYAKVKLTTTTSYILAPNTPVGQSYGFVLKSCNITGNPIADGTHTKYDLARPWQNQPKASYLNCNLSTPLILDEGWSPTSSAGSANIGQSYFTEYKSTHFNGKLINVTNRTLSGQMGGTLMPPQANQASTQLTDAEALGYTTANIFANASPATGSWDPCAVIDCATAFTKSVIVNNFMGTKGTPSAFTWNTSFPISGDVLSVYRATATPPAALGAFSLNGTRTEPNDTTYNYTYSDAAPASGSLYKYYVQGSVSPRQTTSDTVTISAAPTIAVTGSFSSFSQLVGSPSASQTVSVAGTDLQGNILITAPANYQVSNAVAGTYASTLTLTAVSGAVASTPIYVRLNAAGTGTYTGNVALTSTNATTVNLAVTGSTIVATPVTTAALQWWPLRVSAADSAGARNARLTSTTPTLKHFYVSNGTTFPTIPAYSSKYGQALGANNVAGALTGSGTGDGLWSASAPYTGPGGNIKRNYYEQFTMTVAAGSTVRVDALSLQAAFYNTSSSTTMGMVYSKSGFVSDSTEITSATLNGTTATYITPGSATSNLTRVVGVLNNTAGPVTPTNLYRLTLSDPSGANPTGGVTLTGGQTLSFRLYFTCSSGSVARYAMLRNLRVEGDAQATTVGNITLSNGTLTGTYNNVTITSGAVGDQVSVMLPLTVNNALTTASGAVLNPLQPIVGAGSVSIGAGSELRIGDVNGISSNGTSSTSGPIRNTGARSFDADASYTYNGTAAQVTGSGLPATVRNLSVNNTATLAASQTLTLSQAVSVAQVVRLTQGNLVPDASTGKTLTLLSSTAGTALVDNTGGIVSGTATMQRAITFANNPNIGYHHFSSPVVSTTVNTLAGPAFTPEYNLAYNTAAVVGVVRPFPTMLGYNETRTSSATLATDQTTFNKGFYSLAATDPMTVGRGFVANMPNANLVSFTGTFNNGSYMLGGSLTRGAGTTSPDDGKGWQLLGNPYPSPIDWGTMLASQFVGVNSAMYVYNATDTYAGTYRTYLPNGLGTGGIGGSSLIDAGSGFFVQVTTPGATAATLSIFTGTNRVKTFGAQPAFGRAAAGSSTSTAPQPELRLTLAGNGLADDAYLYFDAQATTGRDAQYDAAKLTNPSGLNLATLAGTEQLAINGQPAPTAATVVPLFVGVPALGSYTLTAAGLANFGSTQVYLRDALTGSRTLLVAGTAYRFTLASYTAPGRFTLEFAPAGTALATAAQALAAQVQLYPNPAAGRFHVVLPMGGKTMSATLTNALGQVVLTRTLSSNEADFAVATPGLYTLRLVVDGAAVTRKVVVE